MVVRNSIDADNCLQQFATGINVKNRFTVHLARDNLDSLRPRQTKDYTARHDTAKQ